MAKTSKILDKYNLNNNWEIKQLIQKINSLELKR